MACTLINIPYNSYEPKITSEDANQILAETERVIEADSWIGIIGQRNK